MASNSASDPEPPNIPTVPPPQDTSEACVSGFSLSSALRYSTANLTCSAQEQPGEGLGLQQPTLLNPDTLQCAQTRETAALHLNKTISGPYRRSGEGETKTSKHLCQWEGHRGTEKGSSWAARGPSSRAGPV